MKVKPPTRPSQKEKIEVYERLLHDLHFHSTVTMRHDLVMQALQRISAWSYAHRSGNGELTTKEQQHQVDAAFWELGKPL